MKLIFTEYLASLKERGELDMIIPDLLSELGLSVLSRPAIGTRQYGVDVAAVGDIGDGEKRVYLLSIKPGDLRRSSWDVGEQSSRTSLNEILDYYIPKNIPKRYANLPVTVILCLGGELHEDIRNVVESFMSQRTNERISFDVWNGDRLAGFLLSGVLREHALPKTWRSNFRKSIALVDEPDISFKHFYCFVTNISDACKATKSARLTAIRQIYVGLWTLYVWARDAKNLETAYFCSEHAVLIGWSLTKNYRTGKAKQIKQIIRTMEHVIILHNLITDDYITEYIKPRTKILHGLSSAVPSQEPLDVNLKLFDLVGRIGIRGLWLLWIIGRTRRDINEQDEEIARLREISQFLVDMINNNPILCTPIKDNQAIDINIACLFLKAIGNDQAIRNWVRQIAHAAVFAFNKNTLYPCIFNDYRDLIDHPKNDVEYRNEATAGSLLVPTLAVWAAMMDDSETLKMLADFVSDPYKHSTLQLWYPGSETEEHLYRGNIEHGRSLRIKIQRSCEDMLAPIRDECNKPPEFRSLSACQHDLWPLIILACRHHRVPIPPHFWEFSNQTIHSN